MPIIRQNIEHTMKMESTPLVYLEYTPFNNQSTKKSRFKNPFKRLKKNSIDIRFSMGYVSHPYEHTYRITTCRHLITKESGALPSKEEILQGLEVFTRYECVNQKMNSIMLEDVNIKIHQDILSDLLFIEITRPSNYNFKLLHQAAVQCTKRFPGHQVYYFQNQFKDMYFRLFEGNIKEAKVYVTEISPNGFFYYYQKQPSIRYRVFDTLDTTKETFIRGASGSPILSRKGEVIGMICAHHKEKGLGIYLPIEKIERLYKEISDFHP